MRRVKSSDTRRKGLPMSTSVPPAWYPDPTDPNYLRWWNGSAWTADRVPLPPPEPPKHQGSVNTTAQPAPSPAPVNQPAALPHSETQKTEEPAKNTFTHPHFSSSPSQIEAESTQVPLSQLATRVLIGICIFSSLVTFTSWFLYATYKPENLEHDLLEAQERHNELVNEAESWQERVDRLGK